MDENNIDSQEIEQFMSEDGQQPIQAQVEDTSDPVPTKKSKKKLIIIAVLAVILLGTAVFAAYRVYFPSTVGDIIPDDSGSTPNGVVTVVNANNKFAFDLYSQYKDDTDNIFFSPYSISSALAMTYEGAKGKTAMEMQSVFGFPADNAIRRSSYASIYNQLNKADSDYTLGVANALWVEKEYPLKDEYLNIVSNFYGGNATNVDFKTETEKSRLQINKWVEEKTNKKIVDLFSKGMLSSDSRLVLINAVYFKGSWLNEFDKTETVDNDFTVNSKKTIKVPTMVQIGENYQYAEDNDQQVIEIPYKGEKMSMMIVLPKDDKLKDVEESLTATKIGDFDKDMSDQEVNIYIPKFKLNSKYQLADTLKDMGMPLAFTDAADFTGINVDTNASLKIDTVIHKAFVDVNEEGTEAAAATGVGMMEVTAMQEPEDKPKVFRADHPFIFMIRDIENGNILFVGRVNDPTA